MLKIERRKRKEATGSWRTVYYITGTHEGHRIRESLGTDRKEEAHHRFEKRRAEIISALAHGRDVDITFSAAAESYIEAEGETRFLERIILQIGEHRIADLTAGYVQDVARKLYPKAKPATRNRQAIGPILAVINHASERSLCGRLNVKRFKEGKTIKTAVTREWTDAFLKASREIGHYQIGVMQLFMFTTGSRLGETEKLTFDQINLEAKAAKFLTKNGDERVAILTNEVVRALRTLSDGAESYVFGTRARRQLYKVWHQICSRGQIDYVPPHQSGRHSFATEMIVRNKVDPKTTAELGGWKSVKLLVENYTHPEKIRDVAEQVFGKNTTPDICDVSALTPKLTPQKKRS